MSGITSTQAVVEMPDQPVDMMGMQDKVDSLVEIMTEVENARATIRSQSACLWRGEHNKPRSPGWPDPVFDPKVHLAKAAAGTADITRHTFADLGIAAPPGASSSAVAGTSPFPLFSHASIPLIRQAVLNPRYLARTGVVYSKKTLIVRNTAAHSQFFYNLWKSPAVMRKLSQAAGVELEPVMETMELGHANIQINLDNYNGLSNEERLDAITNDLTTGHFARVPELSSKPRERSQAEIKKAVETEDGLLPWHYDSYPWVCVAMISDTSDMIGGETVIQRGDGSYLAISQPGMGSAMMLNGGMVRHLALGSSTGANADRITIITSFRPKAANIYDAGYMSNIRPYSDLPGLYAQWLEYRYVRLRSGLTELLMRCYHPITCENEAKQNMLVKLLHEYAKCTLRQMVPEHRVRAAVARHGMHTFYTIRDDYVQGTLFSSRTCPFPSCQPEAVVVNKAHLATCPGGAAQWDPHNAIWADVVETRRALAAGERFEGHQNAHVVSSWAKEGGRQWGIADEMAFQGLGEYLAEFLEMYGVDINLRN